MSLEEPMSFSIEEEAEPGFASIFFEKSVLSKHSLFSYFIGIFQEWVTWPGGQYCCAFLFLSLPSCQLSLISHPISGSELTTFI
jgi:hypothetical protein